ncbi:polyprenyl synthetase family protein [Nocardia sp. NPDC006044]|uniref:polyprenyl synthetase family protein n=1 Tax=Nocardia sp. NPDC006044 TaxID=3364306 RepID=UPI0036D098A9
MKLERKGLYVSRARQRTVRWGERGDVATSILEAIAVPWYFTMIGADDIHRTLLGEQDLIDATLSEFLHQKRSDCSLPLGRGELPMFVDALSEFLVGGKRLQPALCLHGWRAAGATGAPSVSVLRVAAALELFHAFALIQDDIMDHSHTRRGRPVVHRQLAIGHAGHPAAGELGVAAALLLSDLAFGWFHELVRSAPMAPATAEATWSLLDRMRTDTMVGQYLDLRAARTWPVDLGGAVEIGLLKTAKYTVEYPLRVGAQLADADADVHRACTAFAIPLGEAFQLRDDLLGVFGNPDLHRQIRPRRPA